MSFEQLPPTEWSDEELRARLILGEGIAWREFQRRYQALIFRSIRRVTDRFVYLLSNEDTKEIYAWFLVQLMSRNQHRLRCYQPERGHRFSSWIAMLSTHTAWDYVRSQGRQPHIVELSESHELPSFWRNPLEQYTEREQIHLLLNVLKDFSSKERHFVKLYFVEELPAEEVARAMNISIKTVYTKKHKIREKLNKAIRAEAA